MKFMNKKKNSYNLTTTKFNFKIGQRTWMDISSKRINKWNTTRSSVLRDTNQNQKNWSLGCQCKAWVPPQSANKWEKETTHHIQWVGPPAWKQTREGDNPSHPDKERQGRRRDWGNCNLFFFFDRVSMSFRLALNSLWKLRLQVHLVLCAADKESRTGLGFLHAKQAFYSTNWAIPLPWNSSILQAECINKMVQLLWKTAKHRVMMWLSNSTSRYTPPKLKTGV